MSEPRVRGAVVTETEWLMLRREAEMALWRFGLLMSGGFSVALGCDVSSRYSKASRLVVMSVTPFVDIQ